REWQCGAVEARFDGVPARLQSTHCVGRDRSPPEWAHDTTSRRSRADSVLISDSPCRVDGGAPCSGCCPSYPLAQGERRRLAGPTTTTTPPRKAPLGLPVSLLLRFQESGDPFPLPPRHVGEATDSIPQPNLRGSWIGRDAVSSDQSGYSCRPSTTQ